MNDFTNLDVNFDSKTIEQYREDLTDVLKKSMDNFIRKTTEVKEEILLAFIAKYSCHPDEVIACQMTCQNGVTHFWVEKKRQENE